MVSIVLFYGVVALFVASASTQIGLQVFRADAPESDFEGSCPEGLRSLVSALHRARAEAGKEPNEGTALRAFRSGLRPEWERVPVIAQKCKKNPDNASALDAIVRLRYAEEHAVRRGASDIAPLRREVQQTVVDLAAEATTADGL